MAEPSTLIPNISEIMEEYTQPEEEARLEPSGETRPSELPEVQPGSEQQTKIEKEKGEEEEEDAFVLEEGLSTWRKYYVGKGFIRERGFSKHISHFKELIEQRGWERFCKHQKT